MSNSQNLFYVIHKHWFYTLAETGWILVKFMYHIWNNSDDLKSFTNLFIFLKICAFQRKQVHTSS